MKKYRAGIIGIGGIGKVHMDALRGLGNVEVVAICSRTHMKERAEAFNIDKYFTDYQEMIDTCNLDVVHICTTNDTHYPMAKYALEKGLHVVLEKPMTITSTEAQTLYEIAQEKNLVNEIHFHNRFYPVNDYMHHHIESIGDIVSIHGTYVQDWMTPKDRFNWRASQKESGLTRVIADIGTHWMDLIEYVSGHKIKEVFAELKTIYDERNETKIDTEDIGTVIFKTDKGALGTLFVSQSVPGKKNTFQTTYSGKKAAFDWNGNSVNETVLGYEEKDSETIKVEGIDTLKDGQIHPIPGFYESFKEAFRQVYYKIDHADFKPNYATFEDGLHSMKLVEAIYQSHTKKSWVEIND